MSELSQQTIGVGDNIVDLSREVVFDASGAVVPLRPRAWLVLKLLARQPGRVVLKDELMNDVWPDCEVTEDSLVQAIGDVRRALGDIGRVLVRTLPRRGYMLVANHVPVEQTLANNGSTSSRPRLGDRLRADAAARFVGRDAELGLLRDAIAPAPHRPLFYVHGPGGIGKTALLERLRADAKDANIGWLVVDATGVPSTPGAVVAALALALDVSPAPHLEMLLTEWPASRAVLVIDSFECFESMSAWMRDSLLPALPSQTTVVLASRNRPDSYWTAHPLWGEAIQCVELDPLGRAEARLLLEAYGVKSAAHAEVLDICHGHPLALVLSAGELRRTGMLPAALGSNLVDSLIDRCVGQSPSSLHREALEVCARVRTTTVALLSEVVDAQAGETLFNWLRTQSYISSNAQGLRPHDLVRDAIDDDLRRRNPRRSRELQYAVIRQLIGWLRAGQDASQVWFELHFLERHSPIMQRFFDFNALGSISIEAPKAADEIAIARLRDAGLPPSERRRFDLWSRHSATRTLVARRADGSVCGVTLILRLDALDDVAAAADPVVMSALAALGDTLHDRGGKAVSLMSRFTVPEGERRPMNPAMNALQLCHSLLWATEPGLRFWVIVAHHPDRFAPLLEGSRFWRLEECNRVIDGIPSGCFVHDWQAEPWMDWRERLVPEPPLTAGP